MITYDKVKIRENLTLENIYDILNEYGGEPEYTNSGLISATICHNMPGIGSRKLYYYKNSNLFHCFTGCEEPSFDIFQLIIKIFKIQHHTDFDLNDAVRFIAYKFNLSGEETIIQKEDREDWKIFEKHEEIKEIKYQHREIQLKTYDNEILNRFNYNVKITPWINDGIADWVIKDSLIGYYPGGNQITIPHFDKDNRFIGLRGRTLCEEDAKLYGKYRPLLINQVLYTHPLGANLYNLNKSKDNIKIFQKAIIFESEKSTLQYKSFMGKNLDISVACCGSNITEYQIFLLQTLGAKEIIVGFDRQFININDDEFKKLVSNLKKIQKNFRKDVLISLIFDKNKITSYKSSPTDEGKDKFIQLFNERIFL